MIRKLDLKTGKPVWLSYRAPPVPVAPLTRDARCEVLVVGMGISGAMVAEALTAGGHSVMMIDRRGPIKGSTAATTALIQHEIDEPLTALGEKIGKERARQAWRRSRLAVANLAGRIERLGIDCGATTRPSLYLAGNVLGPGGLRAEAEERRAAGLDACYLTRGRLEKEFGIARDGGIVAEGNLALDPRKLTSGLLLAAHSRNARLHAPVEATALETDAAGVTVSTKAGPVIRADHVVLATGYELLDSSTARAHSVISTWAIATAPQKRALWPRNALIWEASDSYLYLRATVDGRVICGGEDKEFTDEAHRDSLMEAKAAAISRKLKALLPQIDATPAHEWAGSFGTTATGLPIIAPVPRKPRVTAVMAYGGNGITFAQIASEIVSAALDGHVDMDAGLFAFP